MPMVYELSLATAGVLTTSGTPNTETDAFFVKPGSVRGLRLSLITIIGRAAALTALSGLAMRLARLATASTSGTGITPTPADPGMQAAKLTCASRPTAGSTRLNRMLFGCGVSGPGGFFPPTPDYHEVLEAAYAGSIDMFDISATASMTYEWSANVEE